MAPEGDAGGGGTLQVAGAAPKAEAPPAAKVEAKAPAAPAAPAPQAKVEAKVPPAAKVDEPKGDEPKGEPTMAALLERLNALETQNADLHARVTKSTETADKAHGSVRDRLVTELLAGVEMLPKYHEFAKARLGDLDPTTDVARSKVDEIVKAFPEWVKPKDAAPLPNSDWLKRIEERQQKGGASTRGTMLGAISPAELAAFTGRRAG